MESQVIRNSSQLISDRMQTTVSSIGSVCDNTFLQETSYNSDIDISIRQEIEAKFRKSKVNAHYVFPRTKSLTHSRKRSSNSVTKTSPSPQVTPIKQRLTLEKSLPIIHKSNKNYNDSLSLYSRLNGKNNSSLKKM